ncbi:hypothetical protein EYA84_30385, partial [Verrucosispora sp. SN26_14.1]
MSVQLARPESGAYTDGLLLGIDFGGTKMAVGVADRQGRLMARERVPTYAERGAPQALDRALRLAARLLPRLL